MTTKTWHQYRKGNAFIMLENASFVDENGNSEEFSIVSHQNAFPEEKRETSFTGKVSIWPKELTVRVKENDEAGRQSLLSSMES